MDTNICVNKVFTDVRNNKQFRLLWIDPQGSESYVFWLHEKTGVPSSIRINEIEEGLEKGWLAETEDPFGMTREPSREEMERRDRIWEQMKDALQDEPGIYNKKIRSQHLKKIEDEGGEKENSKSSESNSSFKNFANISTIISLFLKKSILKIRSKEC